MEAYKRRKAIVALLRNSGEATIDDLAARFGVSGNSVRNDLDALEQDGLVRRVRGGAVFVESTGAARLAFAERARVHQTEKHNIGRWAAGLVRDNDAIILDDSGSAFQLATFLRDRRNLTVVTNGLDVALLLAQNLTHRVLLAANEVCSDGSSVVGNLDPALGSGFLASWAFVSCTGFSPEQGLTESDGDRAQLKTQMARLARQVVALVDHSKFGHVSTFRSIATDRLDHFVTDHDVDPGLLALLRRDAGFPITVVGPDSVETLPPPDNRALLRRYRIGFGNLSERMVFAQQVRQGLELAARDAEQVELFLRDNNLDRQTALDNADWFVAQRVDLVIEYQIDNEAGNVIMDKFQRAGIPVIAVDIPLPGATFFGADNYRAGRMAGEGLGRWLLQHWDGRLDLLLELHTERVGPVGTTRLQGQRDGLTALIGPLAEGQIQAVDCPVILADVTARVLELLPTIRPTARVAIIVMNDDAAIGALAAFEHAGRLDQVVAVGQNADLLGRAALSRPGLPFIGSTAYRPERYGERLIELALRLLRGEAVPPAVYCHHTFISRENLDQNYPADGAGALPALHAARDMRAG